MRKNRGLNGVQEFTLPIFLAFLVRFFLPFPRILGVPRREKPLFFFGVSRLSAPKFGRREKTPTPKTRFSIWTLLRAPGRFTTRPLPVHFITKMSVVRPFSVLSKDEIGP